MENKSTQSSQIKTNQEQQKPNQQNQEEEKQQNQDFSQIFKEFDVNPENKPSSDMKYYKNSVKPWDFIKEKSGNTKIQAISQNMPDFIKDYKRVNGFFNAIDIAYNQHVPLEISPDAIWLLIIQKFSKYVEKNAEKMRKHFVNFDGKQTLKVQIDNFVFGQQNPWDQAFPQMCEQIKSFIGDKNEKNLNPQFSTTGPTEKAAFQLSLMDTMKVYFEYNFSTCCGIPKVKLTGKLEDWENLKVLTNNLSKYDCQKEFEIIIDILEEFIESYKGNINKEFWNKIFKSWSMSGMNCPTIDGWIVNFFGRDSPIKEVEQPKVELSEQEKRQSYRQKMHSGLKSDDIPQGLAETPFKWQYFKKTYDMNFYSGFIGTTMDGEYVKPVIGWAVGEKVLIESRRNFIF